MTIKTPVRVNQKASEEIMSESENILPTTIEAVALEEARQNGESDGWKLLDRFLDRCEAFLDCEGMASSEKEVSETIARFVSEARDDLNKRRGGKLPAAEELLDKLSTRERMGTAAQQIEENPFNWHATQTVAAEEPSPPPGSWRKLTAGGEGSVDVSALAAELCRKHNDADRVAVWEIHDVEALIRKQFRESTPSPVIEGKWQPVTEEWLSTVLTKDGDGFSLHGDKMNRRGFRNSLIYVYRNLDNEWRATLCGGGFANSIEIHSREQVGQLIEALTFPPRPAFVAPEKPEQVFVHELATGRKEWAIRRNDGKIRMDSDSKFYEAVHFEVLDPNSGEPVR